jgi:hypothetical protein
MKDEEDSPACPLLGTAKQERKMEVIVQDEKKEILDHRKN